MIIVASRWQRQDLKPGSLVLGHTLIPNLTGIFFFFPLILVWHLQHMEVPRLGVESEMQLRPTPQPRQDQIQATSVTWALQLMAMRQIPNLLSEWGQGSNLHPHWDNAGSLTRWATTGIPRGYLLMDKQKEGQSTVQIIKVILLDN